MLLLSQLYPQYCWLLVVREFHVWVLSVNSLQAMMKKKLAVKMVMAGKMTWKTLQRVQPVETSMAG